ncbi:MAG: SpoIIE family protein phosphatase, partial [Flavobacteriales bacterium]|nr:SpoIIE family protein phosphatase [Flavobacteriales bacterium]
VTPFEGDQWEEYNFVPNGALNDEHGSVWFVSNKGLIKYDPSKDQINNSAPKVAILGIEIGDSIYNPHNSISLPWGAYKMNFEYVGLSLKASDKVQYSYYLEGHDLEWSELTTSRETRYPNLGSGIYTFKVKAYNSDMIGGEVVAEIPILIQLPFWKRWWFYVVVILVIGGGIRYFIYRREQIMIESQEKLQLALDEATAEVVAQKELVEIKNKDITDSIIYAKNIQKAMLPHPDALKRYFKDAFVFYKPRDIVSGDFYWVDRFENKVVIACADCTGHGVPGAFMSLISSVLLKGVSRLSEVSAPNQFLEQLDSELTSMLQDEDSNFSVDDGMDISVVEIDTDTNRVRISAARRPVWIVINGEMEEIKGDRFPIGGSIDSPKQYTMHELDLQEGDAIYQFSDGLPDQFGGANGKKLKKTRIIELLNRIKGLPMLQQEMAFRNLFADWKGHLEQVDDIIFMGFRV